jgi:CRP-like cAMP-binding protein
MDLGACDYITKPFEESELLSAIESRIKRNEIFERKPDKENKKAFEKVQFEDLEKVFKNKNKYVYKKGKTIYCKGNSSNFIFYIIRGEVKTYSTHEDGKELITGIFEKHDFFGFTSFTENMPYRETAVAIKESKLLKIGKTELYDLIKKNPQIAINFMDVLTKNLNCLKENLIHLAYDSVRKKIAESILLLSTKSENKKIEISRYDLASLVGIAKETLIRTLTEFKEENIIKTDRNSIKIIDINKLRSIR